MKVMTINKDGAPEMVDIEVEGAKGCPYHRFATLIKHEAQDWREYKSMGEKYLKTSHQEFEHMLVAIDDFIALLKNGYMLDEHEKAEAAKLLASLRS